MRVLTIAGTRPELIRLSLVVPRLDELSEHCFAHTGQNAEPTLHEPFFESIGLRRPDVQLTLPEGGWTHRVGAILPEVAALLERHRPDRVVILGDTDSALSAIVAARAGVPVVHLEAGNRCYDTRVPEEINRRLIDHASTVLCPYTSRSAENLVREGIDRSRIVVTGNPIGEVLATHADAVAASDATRRLGVDGGPFALLTLHRSENVDDLARLERILDGVAVAAKIRDLPVVFSVHPRTADRLLAAGRTLDPDRFVTTEPLGFHDFVQLERSARLVLSDSGTVQEECAILGVPDVVLRDSTERPETLECGSAVLAGGDPEGIVAAVELAESLPRGWRVPDGYDAPGVAATIVRLVLGHLPDQVAARRTADPGPDA